ncbi:fumarylacetoacetase [Calidifontimicrobium sp. SYSU G02091]|uniref:fumarylacetoacetase n=1 Tax=Calidifontimicrobium sp. SYSU G02091 TaxID=2926421 RepID=UPI001F5369E0|nr:fumarylacetoacetase [Calidifontimicrobium sp. SYSU G02091]MCI1193382.1 fumarylacetoacetase [Calidifontimicrobium sp. SYSU G02091]
MIAAVDETHDPALQSWVESANDPATDFPIQNLPFGRFRRADDMDWRIGVAIGDQVLDLRRARLLETYDMNRLMRLLPEVRQALRLAISQGLRRDSPQESVFRDALVPQSRVRMGLPCEIGDYTDFYTGIHHATTVGKLFRPDNPLLPNYKWVPIGYHGRASTINASPNTFKRPLGQRMPPGATQPTLAPSARLDYELEVGLIIGRPNPQGEPIRMKDAEDHLFGVVLLNDWSARDIQAWEYQPLGPFLSKNFASTISPWIVTMEALAPFRRPFSRPEGDPQPLPYLDSPGNRERGAIDMGLEVWIQTSAMREAGHAGDRLSRSNFTDAYWTAAQLVAHHTVNGCSLSNGDLFGSGTLSGPMPEQAGSLLELTHGGVQPLRLSNGEMRSFLHDGDAIVLRGRCEQGGFRSIGFGECAGTVQPALDPGNL